MAGCERGQPDVLQLLGGVSAGHPGGRVARWSSAYDASAGTQPAAEGGHPTASPAVSDENPTRSV